MKPREAGSGGAASSATNEAMVLSPGTSRNTRSLQNGLGGRRLLGGDLVRLDFMDAQILAAMDVEALFVILGNASRVPHLIGGRIDHGHVDGPTVVRLNDYCRRHIDLL